MVTEAPKGQATGTGSRSFPVAALGGLGNQRNACALACSW